MGGSPSCMKRNTSHPESLQASTHTFSSLCLISSPTRRPFGFFVSSLFPFSSLAFKGGQFRTLCVSTNSVSTDSVCVCVCVHIKRDIPLPDGSPCASLGLDVCGKAKAKAWVDGGQGSTETNGFVSNVKWSLYPSRGFLILKVQCRRGINTHSNKML